jgi:hypothetical protein
MNRQIVHGTSPPRRNKQNRARQMKGGKHEDIYFSSIPEILTRVQALL